MSANSEPRSRRRLVILAGVIALLAAGVMLGRCQQSTMSPCERYADAVIRALDNCHSGQNRSMERHVAECERSIDPSEECIERIGELTCPELENGIVQSGPDACRRSN